MPQMKAFPTSIGNGCMMRKTVMGVADTATIQANTEEAE